MMHSVWAPEHDSILVVDDDESSLKSLVEILTQYGYQCQKAKTVDEATLLLHAMPFILAILDVAMPGKSGLDLLRAIRAHCPDTGVIMLSGLKTLAVAMDSLRGGADDYLVKPVRTDELLGSIKRVTHRRRLAREHRKYDEDLERRVQERTQELQETLVRIEDTYEQTLQTLGAALDTRDVETQAHSKRVTQYGLLIGKLMGMTPKELTTLRRGVYLHDIGKIGIPDHILLKPGALTDDEYAIMKTHPHLGARLISRIAFLKDAAEIVYSHHERYDGTGYPRGLKRKEIVLGARIFSVADTLDAITSNRPYRKAMSFDVAREEIARYAGSQFDPDVVDAFFAIPKEHWTMLRDTPTDRPVTCLHATHRQVGSLIPSSV